MRLPDRIYVTGTDTDVGKTVASAALCAAFGYRYWKPVQAGLDGETDTQVVARLSGVETFPEAFCLRRPASPHAAAADEGVVIDPSALRPPEGRLLVEGAGGWCVPYHDEPLRWQAGLVRHLGLPVVVVARTGLGTLNHTFLTLRAIRADGVPVAGVLFVGDPHPENERDVARWGGAPVLGRLPRVADPDRDFPALVAALHTDNGAPR
ncbi:MAG: dethiobiotin synthase [Alphaproteobacteria bacterium]|nr:dethiobiotin synthase [Alphaproteobacteria bacterium]